MALWVGRKTPLTRKGRGVKGLGKPKPGRWQILGLGAPPPPIPNTEESANASAAESALESGKLRSGLSRGVKLRTSLQAEAARTQSSLIRTNFERGSAKRNQERGRGPAANGKACDRVKTR